VKAISHDGVAAHAALVEEGIARHERIGHRRVDPRRGGAVQPQQAHIALRGEDHPGRMQGEVDERPPRRRLEAARDAASPVYQLDRAHGCRGRERCQRLLQQRAGDRHDRRHRSHR
jgi:hypothetical protein